MKKIAFGLLVAGALVIGGCSQDTVEKTTDKSTTKQKNQVTEESSYEKVDPKENKQLLNNKVIYYETPKVQTPKVHKDAEKEVVKLAKKKKINVKPNLKDGKFRDLVYNAASDIGSLSKDKQKKIADYVKYVDKYENSVKNKRIQELLAKVKTGKITGKERAELESLLPIKGGEKIKNLDPKKPDADNQTPPTGITGGNQQETPDNQNNVGGQEQPGNEQNQQNVGGNNQPDPNQNGNEQNNQQTTGGTEQNNNNTGGNQTGGNQSGGNNTGDNQPGALTGGNNEDENELPTGSYDPQKAIDYAHKWWDKRNNDQYGYYSRVTNSYDDWYDCTNFVSQAIKEGGIQEKRNNNLYWYYSDTKPSYAWGVANSLYKHFKDRKVKQVRNLFDLEPGDVVNADFDHDGDIEHSAIVTKVTRNEVYITQHTADKKDAKLSPWFIAGYDVYGWKMQTANK